MLEQFTPVTRYAVAPKALLRQEKMIALGAQGHPDGMQFRFDAITRARAHHFHNPDAVVGGWSAAAYLGVPCWVDDAQTVLIVQSGRRRSDNPMTASRIIRRHIEEFSPDPLFPALRCALSEWATVDCLSDLASGSHGWKVPSVPGLSPALVRSVQFVDAMRRFSLLDTAVLEEKSRGIYDRDRLTQVLALSADGADSPPETILRLVAGGLAPNVETQIPVYVSNRLLTVIDVGWQERKVALFYDGEHHLHRSQRDYDSEVNATMREMGWVTLRVTHGMLRNPTRLRQRIGALFSP